MKLTPPTTSGRNAYYDRNPTDVFNFTSQNALAPHALTNRWTYTVPAGRKAYLSNAFTIIHIVTAATTAGQRSARITTPSVTFFLNRSVYANAVDTVDQANNGGTVLLLAGDASSGADVDVSTGGTVDFLYGSSATEFDA